MKKTKLLISLLIVVLALAVLVLLLQMARDDADTTSAASETMLTPYTRQSFAMDTYILQQVFDADKTAAEQTMQSAEALLSDLEAQLSAYLPSSAISKINAQAGLSEVKRYHPPAAVYDLIARAKAFSKVSDGAFDITVAPLTRLWGISDPTAEHRVPSEAEIRSALQAVGWQNIRLYPKEKTVWLTQPFMGLDLGGIAKGYACDRLRDLYQDNNVSSALISVGGNILAIGKKPDGRFFSVGLRDPFGGETDVFGRLYVEDKILSTTGAYERYFELNGVRYHHVFDPKTGYPAQTDLESVTVLSEDGTYADYRSTALFVQGLSAVKRAIADKTESVVAVDKNRKVYASDDLRNGLKLSDGFSWGDAT